MTHVHGDGIRAARAIANISGRVLAERSGVSGQTIKRLEAITEPRPISYVGAEGGTVHVDTVTAISRVLEACGVEAIVENNVWVGAKRA